MSTASALAAAELVRNQGFAVLRGHLSGALVDQCWEGFRLSVANIASQ